MIEKKGVSLDVKKSGVQGKAMAGGLFPSMPDGTSPELVYSPSNCPIPISWRVDQHLGLIVVAGMDQVGG